MKVIKALLIFPNQLFAKHPGFQFKPEKTILVEDPLFFGDSQYPANFHKQKLWLYRATMTNYAKYIKEKGFNVEIATYRCDKSLLARVINKLAKEGISNIISCDPVDFIASKRLKKAVNTAKLSLTILHNPGFINTSADNQQWAGGRKRWFMAEFYKFQRRRLHVLMDGNEPEGGQWSFDEDNRKKVPKKLLGDIPAIPNIGHSASDWDARDSIEKNFPNAYGSLETLIYPTDHQGANTWLQHFLNDRLTYFGDYEDAIVEGESWLWHSVLTPMLNIGLLTPKQVLDSTLRFAKKHSTPINSLEGFVRQIIGWREFMRATYEDLGVQMRTTNHWGHSRKIPRSFYDGTTGIDPIDDVIQRVLKTGYCHHIERLMVLGGFMFLCEFDPNEVYRWFMEMFVDSHDWVMVPNVYAMSQHADGGLTTTKPYFSGSHYIRKMSHWSKGDWADVWDGLYWRFIFKHKKSLGNNPRWAMMCRTADRMKDETRKNHLNNATIYLSSLT